MREQVVRMVDQHLSETSSFDLDVRHAEELDAPMAVDEEQQ